MKAVVYLLAFSFHFSLLASKSDSWKVDSTNYFVTNNSGGELFDGKTGELILDIEFSFIGLVGDYVDKGGDRNGYLSALSDDRFLVFNGTSIDIHNSTTGKVVLTGVCFSCFDPWLVDFIRPLKDGNFLVVTRYNEKKRESAKIIKINSYTGKKIFEYSPKFDSQVKRNSIEEPSELQDGSILVSISSYRNAPNDESRFNHLIDLINAENGQVLYSMDALENSLFEGELNCRDLKKHNLICQKDRYIAPDVMQTVMTVVESSSGKVLETEVYTHSARDYLILANGNFISVEEKNDGSHKLEGRVSLYSPDGSTIKTFTVEYPGRFFALKNGNFLRHFGTSYELYDGKTGVLIFKNRIGHVGHEVRLLSDGDAILHKYGFGPSVIDGDSGKLKTLDVELENPRYLEQSHTLENGNFVLRFPGEKVVLVEARTLKILAEFPDSKSVHSSGKNNLIILKNTHHSKPRVEIVNGDNGESRKLDLKDFHNFHLSSSFKWLGSLDSGAFVLFSPYDYQPLHLRTYGRIVLVDPDSGTVIHSYDDSPHYNHGSFGFFSF